MRDIFLFDEPWRGGVLLPKSILYSPFGAALTFNDTVMENNIPKTNNIF